MLVGRRILFVVFVSNLVASTGMAGFLPAFPLILKRLGTVDPSSIGLWTGLLTAAAPFSAALSGPVWGALGDRIGRKVMVLRALAGLTVFVGAMSFFGDPWVLLGLRIGQGFFSGFIAPSLTLVSVHTPPQRQGFVAAVLQSALLLGGVAGPPLGGLLLDRFAPSALFASAAIAAALSATLVGFLAVEVERPNAGSRATGGGSALRNALSDVRETLQLPAVRRMLLALFAVRFGSSCVEPLFALYVTSFEASSTFVSRNLGLVNGALVAATPLGNLLALMFWGRAGDRRGHRVTFALAAGGAGIFYAPQALAPGPWSLFLVRFLAGVFLAGVIPAAYGLVAEETPVERRGSSYSLTFSAIAFANSIAPVVGGSAVSAGWTVKPLLAVSAIPMVCGALWMLRGRRGR